jgi:hypothetical protein
MSGFVERVIEDWLTNSDERSYQIPFVSLLIRSGHKIKYVSKHSTLEFGKDVISVSPNGELTAYQLKAGSINLALWRDIRGEVFELTDPIRSPAGRRKRPDRCFLVTTGTIGDTVREQLRDHNDENREKGLPEIETLERHELVGSFLEVFTQFFPVGLGSFNDLVRAYLSAGAGPVDKPLFCSVLRGLAPGGKSKAAVSRTLSNLVVAAEFASTPFRLAENHISVMDIWILAACRIVSLARRFNLKARQWHPWLDLCHDAVEWSGSRLVTEVNERADYLEGDSFVDHWVLPYRKTIALGYAAAVINARRIVGIDTATESRALLASLLKQRPLSIWSEGSWNHYINLAVAISASPEGDLAARQLTTSWLEALCSPETLGPPYWTVEQHLSVKPSDTRDQQERSAVSYSLGGAMDVLCRRMWRRPLARLWPRISKKELAELVPDRVEDLFDWQIDQGALEVRALPIRGSWQDLRATSFEQRSELFSDKDAWLLPLMLCCYPHRVSRKLCGELDYRTATPVARREWHH